MRILVVEDEPALQEAARLQLKSYEVEVVDYLRLHQIGIEEGHEQLADFVSSFDVLLLDLFMPAPERNEPHTPVKAPVGWCVLLLGLDCGVKRIGLCTDMHRHINVVSFALDIMVTGMMPKKAYTIVAGDARIAILNCDLTLRGGIRKGMEFAKPEQVPNRRALSSSYTLEELKSFGRIARETAEERLHRVQRYGEEPVIDYEAMMDVGLKDWRYLLEVLLE